MEARVGQTGEDRKGMLGGIIVNDPHRRETESGKRECTVLTPGKKKPSQPSNLHIMYR